MSELQSVPAVPARDVRDVRGVRDLPMTAMVSVLVVAVGVAGALCDVSPTGSRGPDVTVTFVVAAFVAWACASAPWWAIAAAGLIATVGTAFGPWMAPALSATALGVAISFAPDRAGRSLPAARVVAAGLVLVSLLNLRVHQFLGASALVAGTVMLALAIIGVVCRDSPARGRAVWVMVGALVLVVLAAAGMAFGVLQAEDKLELGNRLLTDGFDQLRRGETTKAADTLARAAADLRDAAAELDSRWTTPARFLPVVAQHRALATRIVDRASVSAAAAATALAAADVDQLRLVNGKLDVDTLASLAGPFADLDRAVQDLSAAFNTGRSPWLIGAVRTELAKAEPDIDAARVQTHAIAALAARGPAMLGTDGVRSYLVAFTSPGVARGQGGVVDNYAEITITDGKVEQSESGRSEAIIADLTAAGPVHLQVSPEYFARYGAFGAGSATEPVDPEFWTRATMDPDTPTAADVLAQLYAAAGHGTVDGVIVIDPVGLAGLLEVAGPVDITFGDPPQSEHIDADRLRQFLLVDQFELSDADRRVADEAVAGAALQQFLHTALPGPQQLGEALGPPATEGHISWWARNPDEQAVIQLIGMAARLPAPDGRDGLAIVSNNVAGNTIDPFLHRTVAYTASRDRATGAVNGDLAVTLQNTAPVSGYGDYVIGNDLGVPIGTNRTSLSIYSPLDAGVVTVDGVAATTTPSIELGWKVTTLQVDLTPGQTRTVRVSFSGHLDSAGGYQLLWRPQPLTNTDTVDIAITDGDDAITFSGELARTSIVDGDGIRAER